MPGRWILAIVVALSVAAALPLADAPADADPVADVADPGEAVVAAASLSPAPRPVTRVAVARDVAAPRPRDLSPPPVPPPER